jgi:hypothetical protein
LEKIIFQKSSDQNNSAATMAKAGRNFQKSLCEKSNREFSHSLGPTLPTFAPQQSGSFLE